MFHLCGQNLWSPISTMFLGWVSVGISYWHGGSQQMFISFAVNLQKEGDEFKIAAMEKINGGKGNYFHLYCENSDWFVSFILPLFFLDG